KIPEITSTPTRHGPEMPLQFFNYLKECFLVNVQDGHQQYAAWLPLQAFVRMYEAAGGSTEQLAPKVEDLKPYLMFIVENLSVDQLGNTTSESVESLRN